MKNKLQQFFSENDFDTQKPPSGHIERFEHKLNSPSNQNKTSWRWLSAAASVVLVLGFWLGSNHQKQPLDLADVSPKMEEVQDYFVSTIHQELKTLEKNRNLETETVIEEALEQLEELEDDYKNFVKEFTYNNKKNKNYNCSKAFCLDILENVLKQIEQIKNPNNINNEIYI